jgi:hypothetical protein
MAADGTWTELDAVAAVTVPNDLAAAVRKHAGPAARSGASPRSVKRVAETAALAACYERANQWTPK